MTDLDSTGASSPDTRRDAIHFFSQLNMRDVQVPGADIAMEMPLRANMTNLRGGMQGGLIATLIDVVAGRASWAGLPEGTTIATSDLSVHYLASIAEGPARAAARILRRGSRRIVVRVDVDDRGTGELAAVATVSFSILQMRP